MSLDYIVQEVINTILTPISVPSTSRSFLLCGYHEDVSVRAVIHSMLRMAACTAPGGHIISPCYRSNKPVECKNHDCPYVIGHSIYLWVAMARGVNHKGEEGGFGCNYKHEKMDSNSPSTCALRSSGSEEEEAAATSSVPQVRKYAVDLNKRAHDIRRRIFDYLNRTYVNVHFLRLPPALAMDRVREFYNRVIHPRVLRGLAPKISVPARDLTSGVVDYVELYKSDDTIFLESKPKIVAPEEEEEEQSPPKDIDIFPSLSGLHGGAKTGNSRSLYSRDRDDF